MLLAGTPVDEDLVRVLVGRLQRIEATATANTLFRAIATERHDVALTIPERETILRVLDDPPEGLEELRGVLLLEQEWRLRAGLTGDPPPAEF